MHRRIARFSKAAVTAETKSFTIWNPHSEPETAPSWNPDFFKTRLKIASFDPALLNLAVRIETWELNLRKINQRNLDFYHRYDLTEGDNTQDAHVQIRQSELVRGLLPELVQCHFIVVESQMAINTEVSRIAQHLISTIFTLTRNQGNRPVILELDAHLKTRLLQAPRGQDTKAWGTAKALEILAERKDYVSIQHIQSFKKWDDLADVVLQLRACEILFSIGQLPSIY